MAGRERAPLVFHCRRCMATLTASRSKIGTMLRCPKCYDEIKVPDEASLAEQEAAHQQAYETDGEWSPDRPTEDHFNALCPVCFARIDATPDMLGSRVTCPDCGTPVPIKRAAERLDVGPLKHENVTYEGTDEYGLEATPDSSVPYTPRKRSDKPEVPVVCPLCHTRLSATEEEIGTTKVCPDCETAIQVLPPPPKPKAEAQPKQGPKSFEGSTDYVIDEALGLKGKPQPLVPVVCPVCSTRMHAPESEVGKKIVCPDCETAVVIPNAPPELPPLDLIGPSDKGYETGEETVVPEPRIGVDYRTLRPESVNREEDEGYERLNLAGSTRREMTTAPLLAGVFTFLASEGLWPRWFFLSMGGGCVGVLITMLFQAIQQGGGYLILGMLLSAVSLGALIFWIGLAASFLQTIIEDSAEGSDRVENWSEEAMSSRMFEGMPLIVSVVIGCAPGMIMLQTMPDGNTPGYLLLLGGLWLTTPIILLSMLAGGSMGSILSMKLIGTLFSLPISWFLFYTETLVLIGATALLLGIALPSLSVELTLLVFGPLLVTSMMLYCRLLGRVAWCVVEQLR